MSHFLIMAVIIALAGPASGTDDIQVLAAEGHLRQEFYGAPSPVPGYCYWDSPTDALTFHATNTDGYGNMDCPYPWLVHSDSDSLVFWGKWPLLDFEYLLSAGYHIDLSCSVTLAVEKLLSVSREVTGELDTNEHTLVVEFADGTELVLLGDNSGPNQDQINLPPGTYTLHLHVTAYKHVGTGQPIAPYSGYVAAWWSEPDPVDVQPITWSSLKASYRH